MPASAARRRPCSYGPCPFRLSALPSDRLEPGLNICRGSLVKTKIVRLQTPPCNRTVEKAGIKETPPPPSIVRFFFCPRFMDSPRCEFSPLLRQRKNETDKSSWCL